jgi:site-specific DNA-methyltransferase (adenine-specific)
LPLRLLPLNDAAMSHSQLPLNQVLHGNCIEELSRFPENSIDLIFADPPYNLQLKQELWRPNMTRVDAVDDDWDHFSSFAEYDRFTREWLSACRRVLKETGTIWVIGTYHNIYRVGAILQDLDYWILNDVVWIKSNPMPNFRGVRLTNAHETLIWAQKERGARYTFNHHDMKALNDDLQMRSDWFFPVCSGKQRIRIDGEKAHATQKPEALLYRILSASTQAGDIVLDPFFGTGTTGAVAKKLHRSWIGIESDGSYCDIARERIKSVQAGEFDPNLFQTGGKRKRYKVTIGMLLESGMLRPGHELYLEGKQEQRAVVLANGQIQYGKHVGSIHQVGRAAKNAPCNGWDLWYYFDEAEGKLFTIDRLRQKLGELTASSDKP